MGRRWTRVMTHPSPSTPEMMTSFPASSAWDKPGFLLWHATLEWQRQVAASLRDLELTHVQFVLLAGTHWLEQRSGPPSQRELADHAGTDAMMTSQVVRALERAELLVRSADPDDARVKRLTTTPAGADLARRAVGLVEEVDRRVFGAVDDLDVLQRALRRVAGRDDAGQLLERGER